MRKLTVFMLVACLILSATSGAFAASFEDVSGADCEGAVVTLSTLGLLTGYPDGTFRPENTITRAEFCAVAIRSLGLEQAAQYSSGTTIFPDVPATHWASGYINMAVDQGLIHGYPDGTFRPSAPVTYAESLAIIVRLLGYDPSVKGAWPTNYLIKAFELGVTGGLAFAANTPATRGDVALFVNNSLEIPLMEQVSVGDQETYQVMPDTSLLQDKLGFVAETGFVEDTGDLFGTALDADEVDVGGETYDLAEGLNLTDWLGMEVKVWLDGSEVVLAELLTDPDDFVADEVVNVDPGEIEFDELGNCDIDGDAVMFYNFHRGLPATGAEARVLLDDHGDIISLIAFKFSGAWVVTEVDPEEEELKVARDDGSQPAKFELGEDWDAYRVVADGAVVGLDAVSENDVVHYFELANGDEYLYLELVSRAVSGELDEVRLSADDAIILSVDGEDYELAGEATASTDDNDTFEPIAAETDLSGFVGEDVLLLLDRDGNVRHIAGDFVEAAADTLTAMITVNPYAWGPPADMSYYFKAMDLEGNEVRYEFNDDTTWELLLGQNSGPASAVWDDCDSGDFVELELDADGYVSTVTEPAFDVAPYAATPEGDIDADYSRVRIDGDWYKVTSGTVIVDVGNAEIVPWSQFRHADETDDNSIAMGALTGGDITLEILCFDGTAESISYGIGADVGIIRNRMITSDGVALRILTGGVAHTYLAEEADIDSLTYSNWAMGPGSAMTDIDAGDLVEFEATAAGDELVAVTELSAEEWEADPAHISYYLYVTEVDEQNMIIDARVAEDPDTYADDDYQVMLTPDTVYFDTTGTPAEAGLDDIHAGDVIQVFGDPSAATYVKVVPEDDAEIIDIGP